jgi:hypothetical protein
MGRIHPLSLYRPVNAGLLGNWSASETRIQNEDGAAAVFLLDSDS